MQHELVIVLDFGGQYNQLIARRVRECNVYCEVLPYTTPIEKIREQMPTGIILTGEVQTACTKLLRRDHAARRLLELGIPSARNLLRKSAHGAYLSGGRGCTAPEKSEYGKDRYYFES